ncbi:hypothetical protein NHX12_014350 [Muraenolepis orangiensis]|uniref:Uncharacterized protein n=1 Tax=Muraenolepis orangiensis TaxID=630683 RepID=A0A9Q0DDE5_9TELE|nr:hypothetical protein NHX12_014350 [Muraenolepis orangiensis]
MYLKECPRQPYIPIYLVVAGVFELMLGLLSNAHRQKDAPSTQLKNICVVWNSLTLLFIFCWFIAGNVWIYSIYEPNYNQTTTATDPYCNKTLYLFAFWTTTLVYILLCVFLLISCCWVAVALFFFGEADNNMSRVRDGECIAHAI